MFKKNINFKKNEMESKMEIPHTVLERRTLCFSSYKNSELKVKLWWVGACERKNRAFYVPLILSEGIFFYICALSQCTVYWIHFHNIHSFISKDIILDTLFCLFSNPSKASNTSHLTLWNKYRVYKLELKTW